MTPISSAVADYLPWTAPKLIKTEEEYEQTLAVIESMMNRDRTTEQSDLFDLLVVLVERYEDEHYPIPEASPPRHARPPDGSARHKTGPARWRYRS